MRTWGTGIVMLYSAIVLARANWHKGDLHWWITVNSDFSPPSIHGLACKKTKFCTVDALMIVSSITKTVTNFSSILLPRTWTLSSKNTFFDISPRTESHPICFVFIKLILTCFFLQKQLNPALLPPIGRQITNKFRRHVHVLGSKMLLKLVRFWKLKKI